MATKYQNSIFLALTQLSFKSEVISFWFMRLFISAALIIFMLKSVNYFFCIHYVVYNVLNSTKPKEDALFDRNTLTRQGCIQQQVFLL